MEYHANVTSIAEARYAIRKVFRIVDEQARAAKLEPLQHQLLIQVYGSRQEHLSVKAVAERLDIAPAFASRMVRQLEEMGYVSRLPSSEDRRMTEVHITDAGREMVRMIDQRVRVHVEYFQSQLSEDSKLTALTILAFYVGITIPTTVADMLRTETA